MAADGGEGSEEYWALRQASDFTAAAREKESQYFEAANRRGLTAMWRISWAQYYGTDPNNPGDLATQTTKRTGPQSKFIRFRINEVRSLIRQQNTLALGERPAFQCLALNADFAAMAQVETCDQAISYTYRKVSGEDIERKVVEGDGVAGIAYGHVRWDADAGDQGEEMQPAKGQQLEDGTQSEPPIDPETGQVAMVPVKVRSGMPSIDVCYPWDVIRETSGSSEWAIIRERCSKFELSASYPEYTEEIQSTQLYDAYSSELQAFLGFDTIGTTTDDVIVRHFYHPATKAVPNGRYVGYLGDTVLWDLPCPTSEGIPLVEMCSGKIIASCFGYCDGWDLIAIQEMIDQMASDTASNLSVHGRQVLFYEKGSDFSFDKLAEGLCAFGVSPGAHPPSAVNYASMPESVQWFMEYLHSRHEALSGMNSVARGDPKANIKSGQMAALFHSIAIEFQSARQAAFDGYRSRVANVMLDMIRANSKAPFLVEVAGAGQRAYMKEFTRQSLSGVKRVRIETANPQMRSIAGREAVFLQLKDLPPKDRNAAYELLVTGQSKSFTDQPLSQSLRITWENEQLSSGKPCIVAPTDDPYEHCPRHRADLDKIMTMDEGPEKAAAVDAHTKHFLEHATAYQNMHPLIASFLQIPPPPPIWGSPAWQLQTQIAMGQMSMGGAGAQPGAPAQSQQPQQSPPQAARSPNAPDPAAMTGGAVQNDQSAPSGAQQQDPGTGVKLPTPAQPPPQSAAQPQA